MTDRADRGTTWNFSQNNPLGPGQDDVPALLRRVASSIERLGRVDVQDVVFHEELSDDGTPWPSLRVYYHPAGSASVRSPLRRGASRAHGARRRRGVRRGRGGAPKGG
ncbi:hypothetical protein [Cellulomonas shaoxiangyii]|uniref:Uncharacterized protein n=1 Tax=Cellulomonas shaoxiangyii TaxID=2566013 RepID=A0A4P7SGR4_9CELL|nr:hypothetical protein [Cellulomonas shaoxiangyii]QCB93359.1 hypothetical protein E5225_07120 [Cellulomonas shaoxiangyii]TGY85321.1 hypothetical protein E5226_07045 [Cellulomonas shaoxiangyii]